MDIAETTAPKSDQQNYDDYVGGPKTVTVSEVKAGNAEQPVEVHLVEYPGRPYKPSKSMRRVLVAGWGPEAAIYSGRKMTLYGDPDVRFGGQVVGGIKISHLSHIDKPLALSLTTTRGKRAPFTVQPLETPKDTSGRDWLKELNETNEDLDAIVALGHAARANHAGKPIIDMILAEHNRVKAGPSDA
ncbi:hypothetical protein A4X17_11410 [Plantibacter sp. H53]|uniref:hypothetical protein n=1 Tax=Plantibacter sp. H53 TaxID=1827323 RepID=UPI0007D925FF|nr:hypothetical protein [Plantibacter sp. H53]OAN35082.1 hypothetical protein A4X17_11410 [Plantibacter sp. H53]